MLRGFFVTLFLVAQTWVSPVLANDSIAFRHNCSIFDGDPFACQQDPSCTWNPGWRTCEEGVGPTPGNRACSSYDFDPFLCNQQWGCQYDNWSRRCLDSNAPGPGRHQCYEYDRNPRLCNATPGCSYDRRSGRCQDDFSPGPQPSGRWECVAKDAGWEEHGGAHSSIGYDRYDAERNAIALCERYHGRCVVQSCRQVR